MKFKEALTTLILDPKEFKKITCGEVDLSISSTSNADCSASLYALIDCKSRDYCYDSYILCYNPYFPLTAKENLDDVNEQINEFIEKEYLFSNYEWALI